MVATYEELASEDPTIIGRLRQLRDVKLLYTIIVISDIFTEMAAQIILKHQSPDSVICELKQDVQNTIAFSEALKSTHGTAEKKFWSDLKIDVLEDENTLNFSMCLEGGRVMKLEFKDRSQRTQTMNSNDIKQALLSIKQNILADLIDDMKKYFDKRHSNVLKWGAFDIRMFPESEAMLSDHHKDDIFELASYNGAPFNVLKSKR